jgi:hypothetical protein
MPTSPTEEDLAVPAPSAFGTPTSPTVDGLDRVGSERCGEDALLSRFTEPVSAFGVPILVSSDFCAPALLATGAGVSVGAGGVTVASLTTLLEGLLESSVEAATELRAAEVSNFTSPSPPSPALKLTIA